MLRRYYNKVYNKSYLIVMGIRKSINKAEDSRRLNFSIFLDTINSLLGINISPPKGIFESFSFSQILGSVIVPWRVPIFYCLLFTLPETNIASENTPGPRRKFHRTQPSIFRGFYSLLVSGRVYLNQGVC